MHEITHYKWCKTQSPIQGYITHQGQVHNTPVSYLGGKSKGKAIPVQSGCRPRGFQEVQTPRFWDSWQMMVVHLSALRTCRLYPLGNISGTHFCWRLSWPQGHSATGRITSMKNSNDTIGNWTYDFLACTAVPQRTASLHAHILRRSWVQIPAQRLAFLAEVCHNSPGKFWVIIPKYAVTASFHSFPNSLFMNHYKISCFAIWATNSIIQ